MTGQNKMSILSINDFNLYIEKNKYFNDISFDLQQGEVLGIACIWFWKKPYCTFNFKFTSKLF